MTATVETVSEQFDDLVDEIPATVEGPFRNPETDSGKSLIRFNEKIKKIKVSKL